MPVRKLRTFLHQNEVKYSNIIHAPAATAQEIAAKAGVSGNELAKTVMVKLDGHMAMAVVPASHHVNLDQLAVVAKAKTAVLATEAEFKDLFRACDVGAMPPFGNLYGMKVFVAVRLAEDVEIAFNAGSLRELIRLAYADYERLVKPVVGQFSHVA